MIHLRVFAACVGLWLCLVGAAVSQTAPPDITSADFEAWAALSSRAEDVVDRGLASSAALEVLRSDLAEWRARFRAGQSTESARIASIREQIAALGAKPEGDVPEPVDIAAQRADLETRLAEAEVPGRQATAAFEQANGLIGEVDAIIADRQTDALLESEPAIVNPVHWWATLGALASYGNAVLEEARVPFADASTPQRLRDNGLAIGLYLLFAFLALTRSNQWMRRIQGALLARVAKAGPALRLSDLGLDVARFALAVAGLWALSQALLLSGVSGLRLTALLEAIPVLGAAIMGARWLGARAFPANDLAEETVLLAPEARAQGRWLATLLGGALALAWLIEILRDTGEDVAVYWSVLAFPAILLAGLVAARLAQLMLTQARSEIAEAEETPFLSRALHLLGRGLMLVAFVAPLLSAIGYANAAAGLIWPSVMTLGALVVLSLLQTVIFDAFALVTGRRTEVREALVPTLVGFGLALCSLPVFALLWGVRWATLTELWTGFLSGISIGGAVISPANFLTFALVFAVLYMATRLLQGVLRGTVMPRTRLDAGGRNAIVSGTGYVGVILAAIIAITAAGIDLSGLAIVAGALSVGIGFGLQTIVSNFVSGIILLIERPIKLGDWISVGAVSGYVRAISVRSTRIETFDRQDVIVPNADLIAGVVTNYTLGNSTGRVIVPVGVAYGSDTRQVESILREIAEAHPMVLLSPPPSVVFQGFGADSMDFEIRAILRDVNWVLSVKSDMNHEIALRFAEHGIEIPFMQRDIWIRNPEALGPAKDAQEPTT